MDKELLNLLYGDIGSTSIIRDSKEHKEAVADGLLTSDEEGTLLSNPETPNEFSNGGMVGDPPLKPGSKEYNEALLNGTLVSEQDGVLTAPMLDNIDVTASKGTSAGDMAMGVLGSIGANAYSQYKMLEPIITPALDGLGFLQSGMTEGLAYLRGDEDANMNRSIPMTGQQRGSNVQRVPSDLYGWGTVDDTGVKTGDTAAQMLGNGLIDTFSDPLDYIGVGLLGKLGTGVKSMPRFLKRLSDMSISSPAVGKAINFAKDLAIPSRMGNKAKQSKADAKKMWSVVNQLEADITNIRAKGDNVAYNISRQLTSIDKATAFNPIHSLKNDNNSHTGMTVSPYAASSLDAYNLDGDVLSEVSNGLSPTQRSTTTVGGSKITDFSGGNPVTPNVEATSVGTDYSYKLDPSGKNVDTIVTENPGIPSMKTNKEYVDVVNKNIYELEKTFPGFKVYGSARGVGEGGLPHITDDFDGYITQKAYNDHVLGKYDRLKADHDGGTYKHSVFDGESGNIDFNIIQADENGFATGKRANELWRQSDPDSFFKAQAKSAKDGKPIQNPYKPQELIDSIDMTTKTIMDAMESGKPKHILRGDSYLAYGNIDKVLEAQSMYVKSLVGTKGYTGPNFLDGKMLDSPKDNLALLKKMKYKGDLSVIADDPKRMQAAINDHYINSTVLSRAVKDEPENAFKKWLTKYEGGSVHGAGLNTVRLGTPEWYGKWHGNMQYGIKSKATTPDGLIDELDHATGRNFNTQYSPEEKQVIDDLLEKHGVDMAYRKLESDNDLLNGLPTRKDPDEKVSKFLEEYSEVTGKRFLSVDSNFGNSSYVSALRFDEELDALGYYGIKDLNLKSKKLRESKLSDTRAHSILNITNPKVFKGVKGYKKADPKVLKERLKKREIQGDLRGIAKTDRVSRINKYTEKKYNTAAKKEETIKATRELGALNKIHKADLARATSLDDLRSVINIGASVGIGGAGVYSAVEYAKGDVLKTRKEEEAIRNSPEAKEARKQRVKFYESDYYKTVKDDIINGSGGSKSARSKKYFEKWMAKKNKKNTKFSNGGKVNPFMKIGNY